MGNQTTIECTQLYGYYSIVVPTGYSTTVDIDVTGGGGGSGTVYYGYNGSQGGDGDRIIGSITANPGDIIEVYVGGGGGCGQETNIGGVLLNGGLGGGGAVIGNNLQGTTIWYPVTLSYAWSDFMNTYAVWVNSNEVDPVGSWVSSTRILYVSSAGQYYVQGSADNHMNFYVDNQLILQTNDYGSTTYVPCYLTQGYHTLRFDALNDGGPAGFALTIGIGNYTDNGASAIFDTRSFISLGANPQYDFRGGTGGYTIGDGTYVYNSPGGGGAGTAVFLNGVPVIVAGGGGGGGAQGGHGDAGGAGFKGGESNISNPSGYPGYGIGQNGINDEDDFQYGSGGAGTPGGGGGWIGGATTPTVNYDDAPSNGAYGGSSLFPATTTNNNTCGNGYGSGGIAGASGQNGYAAITFTQLGTGKVKVNGEWKQIDDTYVKVGGEWKTVTQAWTKVAGQWKIISGGIPVTSSFNSGNSAGIGIASAYIPGWPSGGGGPASQNVYGVINNIFGQSIATNGIAPVSNHYGNGYGDNSFTASRGLAFVHPNTTISASEIESWGFDVTDVRRAQNIVLTTYHCAVDSYSEVGFALVAQGNNIGQWTNKTILHSFSDPQADRHYHDDGPLTTSAGTPMGTNQLMFIYIYDSSGEDNTSITVQFDDYGQL